MASSNRHWPSMFKSKPCNHHEFNSPHYSTTCKSLPFPSSGGGPEERSPEPKPRWNPKPEQIRILEAIFNSGMVNPPRDEIKKIRAQLQEYGQVGDANVFYWFQNRKSRSKQKNRQLLHNAAKSTVVTSKIAAPQTPPGVHVAPSSTSSSSSDRSSPKNVLELSNSPTGSISRTFFHNHGDSFLHQELPSPAPLPYFFPVQQNGAHNGDQAGLSFEEIISGGGSRSSCSSQVVHPLVEPAAGTFSGLLLGEMAGGGGSGGSKRSSTLGDEEKLRLQQELSFLVTNSSSTNTIVPPTSATSLMFPLFDVQGAGEPGCGGMVGPASAKSSTVFINDVAFEVPAEGPFNVRGVFGDDAVLVHQTGHPVATTEWGLTAHPLQHGAFYFLARTLASPPAFEKHDAAPFLLPPPEFPFNYKI